MFIGLRDRRLWALGLGAAIVSMTPHLAIASAITTIAVLLRRRDGLGLAVGLLAVAAITIPAELHDPYPITRIVGSAGQLLAFDLSTVGALARDLGDGLPLTVAIVLLALGTAGLAILVAPASCRWTVRGQGDRIYQGGPLGALPVVVTIALAISVFLAQRGPSPQRAAAPP